MTKQTPDFYERLGGFIAFQREMGVTYPDFTAALVAYMETLRSVEAKVAR